MMNAYAFKIGFRAIVKSAGIKSVDSVFADNADVVSIKRAGGLFGTATGTVKDILTAYTPLMMLAPIVAGAGAGYVASKATSPSDFDIKEVELERLRDTYLAATEKTMLARQRRLAREHRQGK